MSLYRSTYLKYSPPFRAQCPSTCFAALRPLSLLSPHWLSASHSCPIEFFSNPLQMQRSSSSASFSTGLLFLARQSLAVVDLDFSRRTTRYATEPAPNASLVTCTLARFSFFPSLSLCKRSLARFAKGLLRTFCHRLMTVLPPTGMRPAPLSLARSLLPNDDAAAAPAAAATPPRWRQGR